MTDKEQSSGVQELVDRLREKGVDEGKEQADQLVAEARRNATETVDKARREAEEILQKARDEADRVSAAGEEALRLAGRDSVLALKEEVSQQFANRVGHLISDSLGDEQFVQQLILEIAGQAVPKDSKQPLELLLPEEVAATEEIEREAKDAKEGTLSHFVSALAGKMMREGITFGAAADNTPGVTVKMADKDVEINFHEKAISEFLMRHLLPRFRAIMTDSNS